MTKQTEHKCDLPEAPATGARHHLCTACGQRWYWTNRMINRTVTHGWVLMPPKFGDMRLMEAARFDALAAALPWTAFLTRRRLRRQATFLRNLFKIGATP